MHISATAGVTPPQVEERDLQPGISRRTLVERAGLAAAGAALAQLPWMLDAKGLLEDAKAQGADLTQDTLNGLVAFVTPGSDPYSQHQGDSVNRAGGIAAGTTPVLVASLDRYVRASALGAFGASVPASSGVAALLNHYATLAYPLATGPFASQFARLRKAEKAEAYRRWEEDPIWENSEMRAISGVMIGYVAFLSWSEAPVFSRSRRAPTRRPVGWRNSKYDGPAEGRPELRGYYQGRKKVRP